MYPPVVLYYKVNSQNAVISALNAYSTLYYDEDCSQDAGYYYISKKKNDISPNNVYNVSMTLYFKKKIVTFNYVRSNNMPINAPITFMNDWNGTTPLGYVNRTVLDDNVIRKLTLYL